MTFFLGSNIPRLRRLAFWITIRTKAGHSAFWAGRIRVRRLKLAVNLLDTLLVRRSSGIEGASSDGIEEENSNGIEQEHSDGIGEEGSDGIEEEGTGGTEEGI